MADTKESTATSEPPIPNRQTKAQVIATLADDTGLTRREVAKVLAALGGLIERHLKEDGSGELTIPDTGIRVRRIRKPASRERRMVSPLTGKEVLIQAKPPRTSVKLTALKSLKDKLS